MLICSSSPVACFCSHAPKSGNWARNNLPIKLCHFYSLSCFAFISYDLKPQSNIPDTRLPSPH